MNHRYMDHDGDGRPVYPAQVQDYLNEEASRLGLTFEQAAAIYDAEEDGGKRLCDMQPLEERSD